VNPLAVTATAVLGLVLVVLVGFWTVIAIGVIGAVIGAVHLGGYLAHSVRKVRSRGA
jgi:hypothetical protein